MVLVYEVGDVVKRQHRGSRYGVEGVYNDQKVELSDVISMVRMFVEQKGWSFQELLELGEEHYLERMQDLKKYGVKG
jgi:hypothetical protein